MDAQIQTNKRTRHLQICATERNQTHTAEPPVALHYHKPSRSSLALNAAINVNSCYSLQQGVTLDPFSVLIFSDEIAAKGFHSQSDKTFAR